MAIVKLYSCIPKATESIKLLDIAQENQELPASKIVIILKPLHGKRNSGEPVIAIVQTQMKDRRGIYNGTSEQHGKRSMCGMLKLDADQ